MPMKPWEPVPRQSDTGTAPHSAVHDEPGNLETLRAGGARNPDAPPDDERAAEEYEAINMHGSER